MRETGLGARRNELGIEAAEQSAHTLRMTRFGIIGLSHDHIWDVLPELKENEQAELVAACSLQRPLLDRAAKEYGVQIYTDSQEMAASEQLDAGLIYGNNRSGAEEGKKLSLIHI